MLALFDRYHGKAPARRLLILLPPAEATPQDFFAQGFVDAVRQYGIDTDILLADVDYQHVMAKTVSAELARQMQSYAQGAPYSEIWLAGISLGAFNALGFAATCDQALAGLHLMAPYPGTRDILREIQDAGGALNWVDSPQCTDVDERQWWRWLARQAQTGRWDLPISLSLATRDRFITGQRLLAALLPEQQVHCVDGAHDWAAWMTMWEHWLAHGPLTTPMSLPALAP